MRNAVGLYPPRRCFLQGRGAERNGIRRTPGIGNAATTRGSVEIVIHFCASFVIEEIEVAVWWLDKFRPFAAEKLFTAMLRKTDTMKQPQRRVLTERWPSG